MEPNFPITHVVFTDAYEQKGMFAEAIPEAQKPTGITDVSVTRFVMLGHAYAVAGKKREARQVLAQLKIKFREDYIPPYYTALVYAGLGQKNEAFEWLEKAFEDRQWMMAFLKVDPRLDALRSDPRFADLLRRTGLAE